MPRRIPLLIAGAALLWLTWGRGQPAPETDETYPVIAVSREALPDPAALARNLGPFRMEGAWVLRSNDASFFGYSALVPEKDGRFTAFNDAGQTLSFTPPGSRADALPGRPKLKTLPLLHRTAGKSGNDVESAVQDPAGGTYWLGLEGRNEVVRLSRDLRETGRVAPPLMAGWDINTGAEAMARLADGRFVVIREVPPSWFERRLHDAVLFRGDPIAHPDGRAFRVDAADDFAVVDMAVLPDGRALILMRRLIWPLPMRFAGRIVIGDTARIRPGQVWHTVELAKLAPARAVDNFEGIAAVPQANGRIAVWIISDDNHMRALQRTLLWKLSVDPARLPWPK